MTISVRSAAVSPLYDPGGTPSEDQLAAIAFLARYSGRTLEAYRHDLKYFFQWAADHDLEVLAATRAHIEMYRSTMEQRGLAPSTIDRRLSTACGYFRFAHIDGRIPANPAQYVRRPKVQPTERHGMDRGELGRFLFTAEHFDRDHAALAVLLGLNGLRVSEACATNVEDLGFERGHRTLRILGKGNKPAMIPLVPRTASRPRGSHAKRRCAPSSAASATPSTNARSGGLAGPRLGGRLAGFLAAASAPARRWVPSRAALAASTLASSAAIMSTTFGSPPRPRESNSSPAAFLAIRSRTWTR